MEQMVNHDIYKRVRVVDYQAMCLHLFGKSSFGILLQNVYFMSTLLFSYMHPLLIVVNLIAALQIFSMAF